MLDKQINNHKTVPSDLINATRTLKPLPNHPKISPSRIVNIHKDNRMQLPNLTTNPLQNRHKFPHNIRNTPIPTPH